MTDLKRVEAAAEWVMNVTNGVGKSGHPPTVDEVAAAWTALRAALEEK